MTKAERFEAVGEGQKQEVLQFWERLAGTIGVPSEPEVRGVENVPEGAHVVAFNHRGWAEVGALIKAWPVWPYIMSREDNFKIPVLGKFLEKGGFYPVVRGSADIGAIKRSRRILQSGHPVGIAIEGTRGRGNTSEFREAKTGAAYLAMVEEVPIVPTAIVGSERYIPLVDEQFKELKRNPLVLLSLLWEIGKIRMGGNNPVMRVEIGEAVREHMRRETNRNELTEMVSARIGALVQVAEER